MHVADKGNIRDIFTKVLL